jgi:glycosidase
VRPALEASQPFADRSALLLLSDGPKLKRSMSRYGGSTQDAAVAKELAALLLTTRAGAMLYSGQELGLDDAAKEISFAAPQRKGEQPQAMSVAAENASQASLLNWYRQLTALSHGNRTMSSGAITVLNHDDQNVLAWVRRPAAVSLANPAIVVIENLSDQPVTVSLKADMQKLHLRGSFLRTVLRSDNGMGAMHLDGMTLAPHMVFIGELRY